MAASKPLNMTVNIEEVFRQYKNKIYGLALSMTKNTKEAEDIAQDVFLKIITKIHTFKAKSSLSTWIYRIAYNEALMHLRKAKNLNKINYHGFKESRITSKDKGFFINWPLLPDGLSEEDELKKDIDQAIALMPIKYRLVLLLRTLEGLSVKETSQILNLKENSVKSRLHRARLIIHKALSDYRKTKTARVAMGDDRFCGIATRFIYDYIEGHLDNTKENDFLKHLSDCYDCNVFLDSYKRAISITKALQCADLPKNLQDKIKTFLAHQVN
ncbi:MAG: sigma-70 family RNA polymerase sigma factor [Candidatus Omnitrophica bacterium]|nr:sigma-70 family RNA polymerase sigma factor [Candidatus Omnitrophota bacterium]